MTLIMDVSTQDGLGVMFPCTMSMISSVSNQYVEMLPQSAQFEDRAPFVSGNSLTILATGKCRAMRICSGSVSTDNSKGTSPIHIPFANANFGS